MKRSGDRSGHRGPGSGRTAGCVGAVFLKETTELIRDRRTVFVSLLVPLILFPLLTVLGLIGTEERAPGGAYRIALAGPLSDELREILEQPDHGFVIAERFVLGADADEIGLSGWNAVTSALELGRVDVGLEVDVGRDGRVDPVDAARLVVRFDNRSPRSTAAAATLERLLAEYARVRSEATLREMGIDPRWVSRSRVEARPLYADELASGYLALGLLLPVLALVAGALAPLASAVDLGAGEKERGTLETLLATSSPRSALILGKYLAVLLLGLFGTVAFFAGAAVAIAASSRVVQTPLVLPPLAPGELVAVVALVVAATALCSALELGISIWAPSAKAAQAYALPLLILASAAGYGATAVGSATDAWWTAAVPLLNVAVGLRSVAAGGGASPGPAWFLVAAAVTAGVVGSTLAATTWICGRETVLRRR